jgi:hypothetical protein
MSVGSNVFGLITADWHLRKNDAVWQQHPLLRGDAAYGIAQIADIVRDRDVPRIFALGDLFDESSQTADSIVLARTCVERWQQTAVECWLVQGQHDRASPPVLAAISDWAKTLVGAMVETPVGLVTGLDYQPATRVESSLRAIDPAVAVLATHQVWKCYLGDRHAIADASWLPATVRHVWTGDCHQHRIDDVEGHKFISPGPLCAQSISEFGPKGIWLLLTDGSYVSVPLRTRRYYEVRIETDDELAAFLGSWRDSPMRIPQAGVPDRITTSVVRIRYSADVADVKSKIESKIGSEVYLFFTPLPAAVHRKPESEQRTRVVLEGGMEGCLRTYYGDDPVVAAAALRLWQSPSPQEEIREIIQDWSEENSNELTQTS